MAIKRLHYFDHQFLVEKDFTDEQNYHVEMRRRLNQALQTFGIADGLQVAKSGNKTVTVRRGVAIDRLGQEIVVEADTVFDLASVTPPIPANATVFITIAYREQESDPTTATGVTGNTRTTEQPLIAAVTVVPATDGSVIRLATFKLDGSANVPGPVNDLLDGGVRQAVGTKAGLVSVDGVSNPGGDVDLVPGTGITITPEPTNRRITIAASGAQGLVSVDGVSNPGGNVDLIPGAGIAITPNAPARTITIAAAGAQGLVSVDGVSNPGGDIDLVQDGAIVIRPEDAANRITIGESHSARTDNPHNTTAAQIGALLATDFDLRRRAVASFPPFTQADGTGTPRTVNLGFQPRLALAFATVQGILGGRKYGGSVSGFAELTTSPVTQFCTSFGITKLSNTDWLVRLPTDTTGGVGAGIAYGIFFSNETAPAQAETLLVAVTAVSPTGLTVSLTRSIIPGSNPLTLPNGFEINLRLLCFG